MYVFCTYTLILVLHYRHYTLRVFMHGDYEYLSRLYGLSGASGRLICYTINVAILFYHRLPTMCVLHNNKQRYSETSIQTTKIDLLNPSSVGTRNFYMQVETQHELHIKTIF